MLEADVLTPDALHELDNNCGITAEEAEDARDVI